MNELINSTELDGKKAVNIVEYSQSMIDKHGIYGDISAIELSVPFNEIGLLFNLSDNELNTTYDNLLEISKLLIFFNNIQKKSKRILDYKEIKSFMLPYKFEGLYFIDTNIFTHEENGYNMMPFDLLLLDVFITSHSTAILHIDNKSYHSEITVALYDAMKNKFSELTHSDNPNNYKTYLIKDTSSMLYKIGRSANPCIRHRDIKTGNPTTMLLMFCNSDIESILHKKYADKRVSGEWFKLSDHDITEILNEFKEIGGEFFNLTQSKP